MAGNQAGKSNPASKRMMSAAKKAKRVKNKNKRKNERENEAMSGLPAYREYHVPKKEAPYTYDFGKWMAKQQGTPGALEQERITGRTIHYINEHPRATEAQIKAAVIFGLTRILDREAAEAL